MAKPVLDDGLWDVIRSLLPPDKPVGRRGGRPRVSNRACVTAILFVLKTGIAWEDLPQECGWGSGITAWRRLRTWQRRGVWKKLQRTLLNRLGTDGHIDWSRVVIDGSSVPAPKGGFRRARTRRIVPRLGLSDIW